MIVYKRKGSQITGHGYRLRKNGNGVIDSIIQPIVGFISNNKDTLKNVGDVAIKAVQVGKNTREIVNSIKNELKPRDLTTNENLAYRKKNDLTNIIDRINKLKFGEGFRYT